MSRIDIEHPSGNGKSHEELQALHDLEEVFSMAEPDDPMKTASVEVHEITEQGAVLFIGYTAHFSEEAQCEVVTLIPGDRSHTATNAVVLRRDVNPTVPFRCFKKPIKEVPNPLMPHNYPRICDTVSELSEFFCNGGPIAEFQTTPLDAQNTLLGNLH